MSQRSNFSDIFFADALPVLEALIMQTHNEQPDVVPTIFKTMGSSQWGEQTLTVAGIKAAPEKNEGENTVNDDAIQGFDKTYNHVTYAIQTGFTEETIEDNRLGLIQDTYASLGKAMNQTKQITSFNVINNGFTDVGPDGVSLFNNVHPLIGGGTSSNRPAVAVALSVAGMRQMEVDMMRQVDQRSINIMIMPKIIWAPPELSQTLKELIESPDRPDTPNRAINTFASSKYQAVVSPYLTSITAWGAFADKKDHQMRFYNRVSPAVKSWIEESSGSAHTRIRSRFSVGYSDFIGTWGTTG